jgi:hypothetical protein
MERAELSLRSGGQLSRAKFSVGIQPEFRRTHEEASGVLDTRGTNRLLGQAKRHPVLAAEIDVQRVANYFQ